MKNPLLYSALELSQKYRMLTYTNASEVGVLSDHDGLLCGVPAFFSLGDARDILEWPTERLEKLRTVKPGQTRKLSSGDEGEWGVLRESEKPNSRVRNLEKRLEALDEKIDYKEMSPMNLIIRRNLMIRQIQAIQENVLRL